MKRTAAGYDSSSSTACKAHGWGKGGCLELLRLGYVYSERRFQSFGTTVHGQISGDFVTNPFFRGKRQDGLRGNVRQGFAFVVFGGQSCDKEGFGKGVSERETKVS